MAIGFKGSSKPQFNKNNLRVDTITSQYLTNWWNFYISPSISTPTLGNRMTSNEVMVRDIIYMYKRARELILSSTNLVNSNPGASKSGDSSSGPNEDNDFDIIEPVTKVKVLFDSINIQDVQNCSNGFNDNFTCNIFQKT